MNQQTPQKPSTLAPYKGVLPLLAATIFVLVLPNKTNALLPIGYMALVIRYGIKPFFAIEDGTVDADPFQAVAQYLLAVICPFIAASKAFALFGALTDMSARSEILLFILGVVVGAGVLLGGLCLLFGAETYIRLLYFLFTGRELEMDWKSIGSKLKKARNI